MFIISDFYDYYDCIAKYGIDNTIIYKRKCSTKEVPKDNIITLPYDYSNVYNTNQSFIVYFCGKSYVGMSFGYSGNGHNNFYYGENIGKLLSDNSRTKAVREINKLVYDYHNKPVDINLFRKCNSPIIYYTRNYSKYNSYTYKINFCLNLIDFAKVVDPYTAFQEIQMFVGSALASQQDKKILPISDKLKAESKGFNELSFRRQEHPRKSKRNKKCKN